jgi:hypothetical protein
MLRRLGRMKGLLVLMAAAYLAPMILAMILVAADTPGVREFQMQVRAGVLQAGPIPAIGRFLGEGRLLAAIALTFAWNFGVAACIGSIAVGVLFPLPPLVAVLRGFLIGFVFADRLMFLFPQILVMGGTFLLEIGAYVLAGALGLRLGLAILPPWRTAHSLGERMEGVVSDFRHLFPVVAALLLLGAIWENAGIFLLRRLP